MDYRLYSIDTVGVIFKDFLVYKNIETEAIAMIDLASEKFYKNTMIDQKELEVKWNKNIGHTDLRLMECLQKETNKSYFIYYPAPECRNFNLFGFTCAKNI